MGLTASNEVFARKIALENLDQTAAYSCAYNTKSRSRDSIYQAASALAHKPEVEARIKVLREGAVAVATKKAGYALADAMIEAEGALALAHDARQAGAAVAAITLRSKLSGLLDEKPEKSGPLTDLDVVSLLAMRDQIEVEISRARDALEMTGDAVTAPKARRVIG